MDCESTGDVLPGSCTGRTKVKNCNNGRQLISARGENCGNSRCNQNGVVQPLLTGTQFNGTANWKDTRGSGPWPCVFLYYLGLTVLWDNDLGSHIQKITVRETQLRCFSG